MMTLENLKAAVIAAGYTNIRVESSRTELILADKDGKTRVFYPQFAEEGEIK